MTAKEAAEEVPSGPQPKGSSARGHGIPYWDLFMLLLSLLSLAMVAWVEVKDLKWPNEAFVRFAKVDAVIVALFLGELVVGWWKATSKRAFWRENWHQLIGMVPLGVERFAWLRTMRILRVLRIARLLRSVNVVKRATHSVRLLDQVVKRSHLGAALFVGGTFVLLMAIGFWILELGINPELHTFDDSLWWAISTATTVGYGDIAPITGAGRTLAALLMLSGIGFVGVVASTLSTALMQVLGGGRTDEAPRSLSEELEKLAELRHRGALSEGEFERAKAKLLT